MLRSGYPCLGQISVARPKVDLRCVRKGHYVNNILASIDVAMANIYSGCGLSTKVCGQKTVIPFILLGSL